jgi:hypothetical protein
MNKLEWLSLEYVKHPSTILEYLQDYGVISDNCWKLDQVVNADCAWLFIVKNWKEFSTVQECII